LTTIQEYDPVSRAAADCSAIRCSDHGPRCDQRPVTRDSAVRGLPSHDDALGRAVQPTLREPNEPRSSKNSHDLASASRSRRHAVAAVFASTRPSPVCCGDSSAGIGAWRPMPHTERTREFIQSQ
jgi:hypothetical protein